MNQTELKSFLGMANQFSQFAHRIIEVEALAIQYAKEGDKEPHVCYRMTQLTKVR